MLEFEVMKSISGAGKSEREIRVSPRAQKQQSTMVLSMLKQAKHPLVWSKPPWPVRAALSVGLNLNLAQT